ncbi:MAG: hypothetical protein OIF56_11015 [Cohaesibacter sp.]|nr:hypothetical protein [Cohaesibacter sp.]MCV6603098.1 hypothetical protein [Cohaesibacter sp.]
MADISMDFLDFLDQVYGKTVREQLSQATHMSADDLRKAADAFAPAFLQGLMHMGQYARQGSTQISSASSPSLLDLWPTEMQDAMQSLLQQGSKAAETFGQSSQSGFPFAFFTDPAHAMPLEQLHKSFLAYSAQTQLCEQVAKASGLDKEQLQLLFPMLTAYGLMPLVPPKLDDPAGWIDYLGSLGRQNFQKANKELDAMPNPLAAAFEGLRAGLYPQSAAKVAEPLSDEEIAAQKMAQLSETAMEMQSNYMKGLNGLFESYQAGLDTMRQNQSNNKDDER